MGAPLTPFTATSQALEHLSQLGEAIRFGHPTTLSAVRLCGACSRMASEEVRKQSTVALSGEAVDEVFGGYRWFHDPAAIPADTR
ncbi:asparagine synthase-related protein [Pantoea sp. Tr-811]|uniref:asparagine synthase-related protein n=1 Tax=Pantoea sp. Tr-811 TaxID=2608361 RepID=UPI00351B9ED8